MSSSARQLPPEGQPRKPVTISEDLSRHPLATANQRVFAFIMDNMFATAIAKVLLIAMTAALGGHPKGTLAGLLIQWLYFVGFTYLQGQTPGKMIMKIRVVDDQPGVAEMNLIKVIGRETIGRTLSTLPLMVGYWGASRRQDRKTFHDRIFETHVISYR